MSDMIEAFTTDLEFAKTEDSGVDLVTDGQSDETTIYDMEELWVVRDRPPYLV